VLASEAEESTLESLAISPKPDNLLSVLKKAEEAMHNALSDSFDTNTATQVIDQLITSANTHMSKPIEELDIPGLEAVGRWITKMVGIFGLDANASPPYNGLGWSNGATDKNLTAEQYVRPFEQVYKQVKQRVESLGLKSEALDKLLVVDVDGKFKSLAQGEVKFRETLAMPYLKAVSDIRDEIRQLAQSSPKESKKELLEISDEIRDDYLTEVGVYLDDSTKGTVIKFVPKEELLAQKAEKAAKLAKKEAEKEAKRLILEQQKAEKEAKARIPPTEMFKSDAKFSAWDDNGLPTKLKDGSSLTASALKKLTKEWEKQKKVYEDWKSKSG